MHSSQTYSLELFCVAPGEATTAQNPRKTGPFALLARFKAAEGHVRAAASPLHCLQDVCVGLAAIRAGLRHFVLVYVRLCWFVFSLCWFVLVCVGFVAGLSRIVRETCRFWRRPG